LERCVKKSFSVRRVENFFRKVENSREK